MNNWQRLDTKIVYQNPWITVHEDTIVHPNNRPGMYGWVETPPAVFIIPVDAHGKFVLIQQTRYVTNQPSWELPAGGTNGQDALAAAKLELEKEAHLHADKWEQLPHQVYPWICFAPEYNLYFIAKGLHEARDPKTDTDDVITEVKHVTWHEALKMVKAGEIHQGQTISGLLLAGLHLGHIKA
ncbi:MAG TPA: NUDIX hydrolase [Candidatus Saccharimonadia bacterium]